MTIIPNLPSKYKIIDVIRDAVKIISEDLNVD